jgi:uncharacterized protein YlxP (DUF503 family)
MRIVATVEFHVYIPGIRSLKEKRSVIRSIIQKIQNKFNVSISEIDKLDDWNEAILMCAHVSNNKKFSQSYMQKINSYILNVCKGIDLIDAKIEYAIY